MVFVVSVMIAELMFISVASLALCTVAPLLYPLHNFLFIVPHTMSRRSMDASTSAATATATVAVGTTGISPTKSNSSATAATQSLQLLLRDDYLLTQHELHITKNSQEAAFSYAASLLKDDGTIQQRATEALGEVERKLALVQSLAERVSRTSPNAVAGPLLRLHGYTIDYHQKQQQQHEEQQDEIEYDENYDNEDPSVSMAKPTTTTTLVATRDRCHRLHRQADVLENVATRVESSLTRGLTRMEVATDRLGRVLALSSTLKMILRLQFEATKLQGYDLSDLRD